MDILANQASNWQKSDHAIRTELEEAQNALKQERERWHKILVKNRKIREEANEKRRKQYEKEEAEDLKLRKERLDS